MKNKIKFWSAYPFLALFGGIKWLVEKWHFSVSQRVLRWFRDTNDKLFNWAYGLIEDGDPLKDLSKD